jgi:hypothetical protein
MATERDLITYPTWERYTILSDVISKLTIRERRKIFQLARMGDNSFSPNVFFPEFGFTLSEFAVWYTLGDKQRNIATLQRHKSTNQELCATQRSDIANNHTCPQRATTK